MIQGKIHTQNDGTKYIEIPQGWRRILENGSIHYISPSSSLLKSLENVIEYLKKDGTCKCGLDCPFLVHRVFNFDIDVQNKEQKYDLANNDGHLSTCKLCDNHWQKGNSIVDPRLLQQRPLNQTIKQTAKKPQFCFDGNTNKKANRSRSRLSDGPKSKKSRNISSPLSDIPSPPPIPISSPVQNVPNNLGALNQGPLPSFASIVSSSKFFNPGPNRGPLHPTGSLPFESNNKFAFPKILTPSISNTVTSTVATNVATPLSVTSQAVRKHPVETFQSTSSELTVTSQSCPSVSSSVNVTSLQSTASLVKTVSTPILTNNKSVVMPIINTPTLPSVFSPLDGVGETVKPKVKPPPKPRSRPRPSRAKAKPKSDKSKTVKGADNAQLMMPSAMSNPAGAATFSASSQWPVVMNAANHMQYHTTPSSAVGIVSSNVGNNSSVVSSHVPGNLPISRHAVAPHCVPQQITMPSSIYMATNYQNQAMQISSAPVSNFQVPQALSTMNQTASTVGSEKDSVASTSIVTPSSGYPVVATPRIQAPPPGMMYVAAAPGIGMFPPGYPYAAAAAQQLQINQASMSQAQNKTSSTTTTMSSSQQPVTQGMSSESGPGKIGLQVPGMYVQGAANQMFPINAQGFGVNQYKAPYQFQNAVYPNTMPGSAMTFITPNGAKAAYPGIPAVAAGNIGQFAYSNPYMFGIVMPTTTNQPSTASSTSTRSSPATPTTVTTPLQMIQPQGIQNPAVAAAFESFVPIAPAAGGAAAAAGTPRFSQTLAHLASAYNTFPQPGLVQGQNTSQLHLAYQMMQMNPHAHLQQIASLGGLPTNDTTKHPIPPVAKTGSSSDTSKVPANTQSKTPSQTSPAHSPASEDHGGGMRSPFAFSHTSANSSIPTSPHSMSTATTTTQAQQSELSKTQRNQKCSDSVPSYADNNTSAMSAQQGVGNNDETLRHLPDSAWKNEPGKGNSSNSSGTGHVKQPISTNGPAATDQSDLIAQSPSHCKISPLGKPKKRKKSKDIDASKKDIPLRKQSQNYPKVGNDNISPVRTPNLPFEQNVNFSNDKIGQANSHCPNKDISQNQMISKGSAVTHDSKQQTRTVQNSDGIKSPSYVDKMKYYETNPLLGMKRSCEAIEVYPDPPESRNDDDKEEYYSSNEGSPERGSSFSADDSTSDCALEHRHGVSSNMEEPFRIPGHVQNTKGLHNGGCNPNHNEQDSYFGSNLKSTQHFVPAGFRQDMFGDSIPIPHTRPHFDIGDVVWAQARGLPSWPGQIVDESKVGKGKPDDGKKWVMWFGDHTFSQVEVDKLKTLNEGLRSLDDKARKKKYRAKKARISLEQAITEAFEELEMREQFKARQDLKAKKKRFR